MRGTALLEKLALVDPAFIEEARGDPRITRPAWCKWAAAAACLALLLAAVPILRDFVLTKNGQWSDGPLQPLQMVQYGSGYYEIVDMQDARLLARYGLPPAVTQDMVGPALGVGQCDDGVTEKTFYQYLPWADIRTDPTGHDRPQRAVYVVADGDGWAFALFCNFFAFDSNTHTEADEMFAVYGIDEAADIAYIRLGKEKITDPAEIQAIYAALDGSLAMGNDDFQQLVFNGKSEEDQQRLATQLADSMIELRIAATAGPVTGSMHYYPTLQLVRWGLSYYQLDDAL